MAPMAIAARAPRRGGPQRDAQLQYIYNRGLASSHQAIDDDRLELLVAIGGHWWLVLAHLVVDAKDTDDDLVAPPAAVAWAPPDERLVVVLARAGTSSVK